MSGKAVIRYLLANSASLVAVVPVARIQAGRLPINTALPAIAVTTVSARQHNIVAMNAANYIVTDRTQITVMSKNVPEIETILALIRTALPLSRGDINGFSVEAIIPDIEGPDLDDDQNLMKSRSVDFMVKYLR
jgi:hypothetical protein